MDAEAEAGHKKTVAAGIGLRVSSICHTYKQEGLAGLGREASITTVDQMLLLSVATVRNLIEIKLSISKVS